MSSCLNSWGDCGRAYQLPPRGDWTRKSRAPSGVERVRIGVSISRKPSSDRWSRISLTTAWRSDLVAHRVLAQVEVAIAQPQLLAHRVVLIDLEEGVCASASCSSSETTSIDHGGQLGVDGAGIAGHQQSLNDHVLRAQVAGRGVRREHSSGRNTSCSRPVRSRTSMKIRPPWSRRWTTRDPGSSPRRRHAVGPPGER